MICSSGWLEFRIVRISLKTIVWIRYKIWIISIKDHFIDSVNIYSLYPVAVNDIYTIIFYQPIQIYSPIFFAWVSIDPSTDSWLIEVVSIIVHTGD